MEICGITGVQIRELAKLTLNKTGYKQAKELYFVQLDDFYSVDNRGQIFKILNPDEAIISGEDQKDALQYKAESGQFYHYDGIFAAFAADSVSSEIYFHCKQQAELLFAETLKN